MALAAMVHATICRPLDRSAGPRRVWPSVGWSEAREGWLWCYRNTSHADGRSLGIGPTDETDSDRWCTAPEGTLAARGRVDVSIAGAVQCRVGFRQSTAVIRCELYLEERAVTAYYIYSRLLDLI